MFNKTLKNDAEDQYNDLLHMAKKYAMNSLFPKSAERDKKGIFPRKELSEMGLLGFFGMLASRESGGSELGFASYSRCVEAIASGDGAISTIMAVQSLVCTIIDQFGSNEQKIKFLTPLLSGDIIGAFMLTEPEVGSDASKIAVQAVKSGNHYKLSGTKQFVTSGANASVAIVFAVTDPKAGKNGISAFIVPTSLKGYKINNLEKKLGQKCSDTAQIIFDNVELSPDLILGSLGDGYRIALSNLEGGRIAIAAQATGMAQSALNCATQYAKERKSFGTEIINHQAVAFRLADMATRVEASRQMYRNAARLRDSGKSCLKESSMAKLFASEMGETVCSNAIQTLGGYGYLEDFPLERIYRDIRVCQIYEGTSDIQRILIARELKKDSYD